MICSELEAWLDQGMPEAGEEAAAAHAGVCPRCAGSLAAARPLEMLLAAPPIAAPAALLGRVMAAVDGPVVNRPAIGRPAIGRPAIGRPAIEWPAIGRPAIEWPAIEWPVAVPAPATAGWAGILARPGVALGCAAAAAAFVFASRDPSLQAVARSLGPALAVFDHPTVLAALALGLAPVLVLAALPLFHWAERWAQGAGTP